MVALLLAGCTSAGSGRASDDPSVRSGTTSSVASPSVANSFAPDSPSGPAASSTPGSAPGTPASTGKQKPDRNAVAQNTGTDPGSGSPSGAAVSCPATTTRVSDTAALKAALAKVGPGEVIGLADGTYTGNFVANRSGAADQPVWLCGSAAAVLDGGSVRGGYVLHLDGVTDWRLVGFTVRNGQKGVVVDRGTRDVVQGLTISDIGDEAIHLRSATTHTVVRGNVITATGRRSAKFGEGIYVGSAISNWCQYAGCGPDRSNFNTVIANRVSGTTAEAVDIKEGTENGVLEDNTFDGAGGLTGADSWVDVKGNNWLVVGNSGRTSPVDGFQTHQIIDGWGTDNSFVANVADVSGSGYGFHFAPAEQNRLACDNRAVSAARGLSNVTCT
jgi:hypothetical protein